MLNEKSCKFIQFDCCSYQEHVKKMSKYLEKDNRELNYQNSVIKPMLEKLFQNYDTIDVVDVSTQYKNWDKREWHDRSKYAKQYTPDILIATNWNLYNKDKQDIEYLMLIEIKTPTAMDRKHAIDEVKEYLQIVPNVILTDGITWEIYINGDIKHPEIIYLGKTESKVCQQTEGKNIEWKSAKESYSSHNISDELDEWKTLNEKIATIISNSIK